MQPLLKRLLIFAACLALAWSAHRPLLGAGFLGSDAAVLEDTQRAFEVEESGAPWGVAAVDHRPVAALSLAFSRSLRAAEGIYTAGDAGRLRLEGLLLLILAAFGVRSAVARAMEPWTGREHARAAGIASGALLLVHPLLVPLAAHLPARGDAIGLAASAWSVAFFLRGRQHRRVGFLVVAFLLALLAAASSPAALILLPLSFGLEFVAAHRHRPLQVRLRTSLQVAAGYGAALLAELLVRRAMQPPSIATEIAEPLDPAQILAGDGGGVLRLLAVSAEKVGVVVLPVNTIGVGAIGYGLAVLALLVALHPGIVAARAAPRLWGRFLGGWAVALTVLLLLGSRERFLPSSLGDLQGATFLGVCMAVGLGTSATALAGMRRTVLPVTVGALYAFLAAGSGQTIEEAAAEVGALQDSVLEAAREDGWTRTVVVLDPPRVVAGVHALRQQEDRSLASAPFVPLGSLPVRVLGLESASFWAVATSSPEFEALRSGGVTLLLPKPKGEAGATRAAVRIPGPGAETTLGERGEFGWVGEGASPASRTFDPFEASSVRVIARAATSSEPVELSTPLVRWRGSAGGDAEGTAEGVWVRGDGGRSEAIFYPGGDLDWLASGEVLSVWFPGTLARPDAAVIAAAPRPLPETVVPRVVGEDWTFDLDGADLAPAMDEVSEEWVLWVIDPRSGNSIELEARFAATGRLTVDGAACFHDLDLIWVLDRRLAGVAVDRARGRRR